MPRRPDRFRHRSREVSFATLRSRRRSVRQRRQQLLRPSGLPRPCERPRRCSSPAACVMPPPPLPVRPAARLLAGLRAAHRPARRSVPHGLPQRRQPHPGGRSRVRPIRDSMRERSAIAASAAAMAVSRSGGKTVVASWSITSSSVAASRAAKRGVPAARGLGPGRCRRRRGSKCAVPGFLAGASRGQWLRQGDRGEMSERHDRRRGAALCHGWLRRQCLGFWSNLRG